MLNISGLTEGIVLDHIQAGKSMDIYYKLGLEQLECQTAIIKNAKSSKMGKKDIIKIDGGLDLVNLDILGYIDHNITINIIKDGHIVEKKTGENAKENHKRHLLQKSPLHHLHRAGAAAYFLSRRREKRNLQMSVL